MLRHGMRVLMVAWAAAGWAGPGLSAAEYVVDQKHRAASDENPGTAEAPFKTIGKAVSVLQPGDTVLIRGGVYRESVVVKTAGTAERPIVIQGAPGERVLISGAEVVKGWKKVTQEEARGNPNWQRLYVAELDDPPRGLFQNGRMLLASRWPDDGRLPAEGGGRDTVIDSKMLTQPAGQWEGGTLAVRVDRIGSYFRSPIIKYDPQKHELTAAAPAKPRPGDIVPGKDTYWIEAAVAAIDEPGEFALDARTKPVKVYIWPEGQASPEQHPVEVRRRGPFCVSWGAGVAFVTFRNLELAYGTGSGIGANDRDSQGAHDIAIESCLAHHNAAGGCALRGQQKVTIRRSLFCRNNHGIVTSRSKGVAVEQCYLLGNDEDGLVFSWDSEDVSFVRGASVDHWWDAHPDAFQIFFGVRNLTIDSCLFFNSGQGFMLEGADRGRITNNMIVGTRHKGVILGGDANVRNFQIVNNTIAFPGLQPVSSNGPNLVLRNNVVLPGDGQQVGIRHPTSVVDYNLYHKPEGTREDKWGAPNTHSQYAAPTFRSAPPSLRSHIIPQWGAAGKEAMARTTPGRFYLGDKPVTDHFAVGDHVEVNYDGVPRKVTEVTADYVAFDPPLKKLHHWRWDVIVNWKDRADFAWDLRLADGSAGKGMAEGGKDVGSDVDTQAYLKGDFDGDGRRDVPELPENYDRRR